MYRGIAGDDCGTMDILEYTVSVDDLVAFGEYHADHSPAIKAARTRRRFGWGALYAVVGIVCILLGGVVLFSGVFLICVAVVWVLIYPGYCRWRYLVKCATYIR